MYLSKSKIKESRKSKTSILFQIKQNNEQNIEVGQSMNIISLCSSINQKNSENKLSTTDCFSNKHDSYFNFSTKPQIKRNSTNQKLSIKMSSGTMIEPQKKTGSLHQIVTAKRIDIPEAIQKIQKKYSIILDKNKIYCDFQSFKNLCQQLLSKIDDLTFENSQLNLKVKKYENYFKQLRTKDSPQSLQFFQQSSLQKNQKTSQLKILNLERKVETLNYIIKNYRNNNKQQVKQFQKKINDYKPTIEGELTEMLASSNQKVEEMSKMISYFQKQCEQHYKKGNWVEIVRSLQEKDQNIAKLQERLQKISIENQILKKNCSEAENYKKEAEQLNRQVIVTKSQLADRAKILSFVQKQKVTKQIQCQELSRNLEQLSYKFEALAPLQIKIREKDETLRRNSQTINRIQNQNQTLISKIGSLVKNANNELFDRESNPVETIQKCSTTIQEMGSRFCEQIQGLTDINKQSSSFIIHLYEKTRTSFQKIVEQYKQQLQASTLDNKQLKNRLNKMSQLLQRKFQATNQISQQLQQIQTRKQRCEQSLHKIQNCQQCPSCMNWLLHWGQISNLYEQTDRQIKKLIFLQ